jgi:serine/threonine-protein kinase
METTRLGRYEILAEIGRGAMGRVFRARDPIVDRTVAIKTLQVDEFPKAQQEEILRRFRREAQAAGQLTHPNIVTIFDVGENFFVMELVRGETLQAFLARKGRLETEEMLGIVAPVGSALDYAHARGVVHRDVKPANIMITERGVPKLMDFGLAHVEATVLTRAGQSLGSPAYMPPEQIQGYEPTARADLYSLGVVAYELLTGARPFAGKNVTTLLHQVVHEAPVPPRRFNASLPPRYDELFARALSKNPEERFPDASSFVTELNLKELEAIVSLIAVPELPKAPARPVEELHEQETIAAAAPKPTATASSTERRLSPTSASRAPKKTALVVAAGAALALVIGALGLFRAMTPDSVPLTIESSPPGATVWVDGVEAGVTPLTIEEAQPGQREIQVVLPGFVSATETLDLDGGDPPGPIVFALQPARATLFLTSTPSEAAVLVDGREVGRTPLENLELEEGSHQIEVRRTGFVPWKTSVEARPGESLQFVARLKSRAKPKSAAAAAGAIEAPAPAEGAAAPAVAEVGDENVEPPKKIAGDFARYPDIARRRKMSGTVTVSMVISETGVPEEIRVVESAGEILDAAVVEAVRSWRFEPASRNGRPVRIHWRVRQTFRLGS